MNMSTKSLELGAKDGSHFDQLLADFPGKNAWVLLFVLFDFFLDFRRGHPGLGASDDSGPDGSGFLVPVEDF